MSWNFCVIRYFWKITTLSLDGLLECLDERICRSLLLGWNYDMNSIKSWKSFSHFIRKHLRWIILNFYVWRILGENILNKTHANIHVFLQKNFENTQKALSLQLHAKLFFLSYPISFSYSQAYLHWHVFNCVLWTLYSCLLIISK